MQDAGAIQAAEARLAEALKSQSERSKAIEQLRLAAGPARLGDEPTEADLLQVNVSELERAIGDATTACVDRSLVAQGRERLTAAQRAVVQKQINDAVAKVTAQVKRPMTTADVNSSEFQQRVALLKACKGYVKPLCGGVWKEWYQKRPSPKCQECSKQVDKPYKGLHCSNGGHRICWECMAKNIRWDEVVKAAQEGTGSGDIKRLLDELNANPQCEPSA